LGVLIILGMMVVIIIASTFAGVHHGGMRDGMIVKWNMKWWLKLNLRSERAEQRVIGDSARPSKKHQVIQVTLVGSQRKGMYI